MFSFKYSNISVFHSISTQNLQLYSEYSFKFCPCNDSKAITTNWNELVGALISAARADIYTMPSPSTLISTIYLPPKVHLHTFLEPRYIRQFNKVFCTYLCRAREFKIACINDIGVFRNECHQFKTSSLFFLRHVCYGKSEAFIFVTLI